jgi:signal transducing adaptor molecule
MLNLKFGDLGLNQDVAVSNSTLADETKFTTVSVEELQRAKTSVPGRKPMELPLSQTTVNSTMKSEPLKPAGIPPPKPSKPSMRKAVALYDYQPQHEGDLSFAKGDLVWVSAENSSGWWNGSVKGKTGVFPGTYVVFE